MTRRAWCAMRSGTESRRPRFVNPEIPDPLTRPRPTLNIGLRCLGAVHRTVMLAARVAVRNTHDGNRIGLTVPRTGRTTRPQCGTRRPAARCRHGGRRRAHDAAVVRAAARSGADQGTASLPAAEGAVEPGALAAPRGVNGRSHRAV